MVQTRYLGGKAESVTYTQHYDSGLWLEDKVLGLQLAIEHDHRTVPFFGGMSLGDLRADGKVTVAIWNFDSRNRTVTINKITNLHGNHVITGPRTVETASHNQSRLDMGSFQIFNYATGINVVVDYQIDGIRGSKQMQVNRRTEQEMTAYFGPQGKPPYPWFNARQ